MLSIHSDDIGLRLSGIKKRNGGWGNSSRRLKGKLVRLQTSPVG